MEFSHWRQRDIHAGQKILLGCKIGQASELYDMVHTENFVLVDKKKEFVAYDGTKQRHQTTYRRHFFKYKLLEMTFNGLQFN
jgi:hypothetical protein